MTMIFVSFSIVFGIMMQNLWNLIVLRLNDDVFSKTPTRQLKGAAITHLINTQQINASEPKWVDCSTTNGSPIELISRLCHYLISLMKNHRRRSLYSNRYIRRYGNASLDGQCLWSIS
uniref:Uncharacterized protein n=1 Tax=Spongospora subterranea TaxID=70186 RepID=A0A0H5QHT0_9EUKA|eukprot:CRZ01533.1 hypothetical protein [Spongospora subterranea]